MPDGEVVSVTGRVETPEEAFLREWFAKQQAAAIDNVEAGARQIVTLVMAFYTAIFGILSLGRTGIEASLAQRSVIVLGGAVVFCLLIALVAALVAILPWAYRVRDASVTDQETVYATMLGRKSGGLTVAAVTFGLGLAAFAVLILVMLANR